MSRIWTAVIINGGVPGVQAQEFLERVIGRASDLGFDGMFPRRYDEWNDPTTEDVVRGRIDFYRQHGCKHVMFFKDGQAASADVLNRYLAEIQGQMQAHANFDMTTQSIARHIVEQVLGGDEAALDHVVQELLASF